MFIIIFNTKNIETYSYCFGIFINCDQKYALHLLSKHFMKSLKIEKGRNILTMKKPRGLFLFIWRYAEKWLH